MNFLIKKIAPRLITLTIISLCFTYFVWDWFDSFSISIVFFILFWAMVLKYPLGGIKIRRNAVDKIIANNFFVPQKGVRPIVESNKWHKGCGVLFDTNQPVWVRVDGQGIYLYYLCYRRRPPYLLAWENIFSIEVITKKDICYAELSINHLSERIFIPWNNSFYAPKIKVKS